jgi:anti-sigma regulatory factor (Ser/Thr protein kinase)
MSNGGPAVLSVVLKNQRSEVRRLGSLLEHFADANGLSDDDRFAINLVLDEVVINIIKYAYGDDREHGIEVALHLDGETLTIDVRDDGRPFDPLALPPPDLDLPIEKRPIGGLGVFLVRSTMETVRYRRDGDRNVLTMTRTMGQPAPPGPSAH